MRRLVAVGLLSVLLMVVFGGCNIFSFTAPSDSVADYVQDGREALRDGDYATAIEKFQAAIDDDPGNAYARWGIAKAYLRQSGFTTISIMTEVSSYESSGNLPFMNTQIDSANALYQGVIAANEHLLAIFDGTATNAELNGGEIALDYTGTSLIQGILLFRDTNVDGAIDGNDFNLNALFDASGDFQLDAGMWDQMTPDQQTALVDNVLNLLTNSSSALDTFITELLPDSLADSVDVGINTDNLDSVIANIGDGFQDWLGGGGGGIAAFGGADHLKSFSQGGNQ